ncbi:CbrC family protein [Kribbella italica]
MRSPEKAATDWASIRTAGPPQRTEASRFADNRVVTSIPAFRYHPDPIATGSAVADGGACELCGEVTGARYAGPILGRQAERLCLGCIADGTAAERLGRPDGSAEFSDGLRRQSDSLPSAVLEEILRRTPGYFSWQESYWLTHCGDGAAYLGRTGWDQIKDDDEALKALRDEAQELGMDTAAAQEWISRLSPDGDMTAYLFECLHCGVHLAYSDAN